MYSIKICGIVQGVGFRPFIYKLAKHYDLKGYVLNSSEGVEIEVEGKQDKLELFVDSIKQQHPRAAQIERCDISIKPHRGYDAFVIRQSNINSGFTLISPDLRTCEDCSCELHNPTDFRYEYPFINCTNCGPRYSIIEKTPYDRLFTSMKDFALCSHCREEFENPFDRRFHAQPVACRQCGPKIRFLDSNLDEIIGDPISACRCEILKGKIVGIKGIGGFHMACDATNAEAVNELRKRKNRPDKPFAVMCDIDYLNNIVDYTEAQLSLLKATQAPIVLLPKAGMAMPQRSRSAARTIDNRIEVGIDSLIRSPIAESVAPQNNKLGVFLPYAPHQLLLFHSSDFHSPLYLVMTSGNANDEPIAIDENDLRGLCDYFLTHDRQILNRCDDSVILPSAIDNIIIRRSRGYVPSPVLSPVNVIPTLGTGAELKISFCLAKENQFYMSPYIGNNYSKATEDFYIETIDKYIDWFGIKPELISCDMHPDYLTTHYAENTGLPIVKVQHHHAHIAAVMAEN
ncbi:MAG: Sua5/YciO/YrdC/YwlC family protein, partial [Candidatus Cloacimonadaceae bacterium]|nr:Sua5/YciO/YrdC/YwlC family protein [Candidatus Cloacimonadaceae bacterium]